MSTTAGRCAYCGMDTPSPRFALVVISVIGLLVALALVRVLGVWL